MNYYTNHLRKPEDVEQANRRERKQRWGVKGKARVSHPLRGEIVVPCASKFAALLCAAEVWRCNWIDIKDAEVWRAGETDQAVAMPPTLYIRRGINAH
ncbi:MAG: hypothetical protein RRY97_09625 [Oscillibacter sp.]